MHDSLLQTLPNLSAQTPGSEVVSGLCGICPAGCGIFVTLKESRIKGIAPWKSKKIRPTEISGKGESPTGLMGHPQGICCPRGVRSPEIVYSPDRLTQPLKRVGARGAGQFEPISWDEALDAIAQNLNKIAADYGPEAACMFTGRGSFERSLCDMLTPAGVRETSAWNILFPFGSPNTTGVGAICYVSHGMIAPATTDGVWEVDTYADLENADLIVVWGDNPATDSAPMNLPRLKTAQKQGIDIICIDPRRTETVRATNAHWLGIRPGTDGALALSMIQVIIEEELFDRDFVENWTVGFAELTNYVAGFTPEAVEKITYVSAHEIRQTARTIAAKLHRAGIHQQRRPEYPGGSDFVGHHRQS
jgi:anaerobic selenocysteine-containing dehydrogenase